MANERNETLTEVLKGKTIHTVREVDGGKAISIEFTDGTGADFSPEPGLDNVIYVAVSWTARPSDG